MKPVTCLIVDDERLARRSLRRLAEAHPGLELVGESSGPEQALQSISDKKPQLLLLDIHMPRGGGFAVLDALEKPPAVIFVTAHDLYAIRAFEVNAVDYLLKPVEAERFDQAVNRALLRINGGADMEAAQHPKLRTGDVALCEIGHSGHFVAVEQILAVEAEGNYTRVTNLDGVYRLARQTLKDWASRLPADTFIQLDRSFIINARVLQSVEFNGRSAQIRAGERRLEFELGPAAAARLRGLLGK